MKTFYVKTFGCQMNKSDSEKMCALLEKEGLNKAESIEIADVVVFNTCCVRENAENKFFGHVSSLKNNDSTKIVVAAGCLAQRERERLLKDFNIDIALGPQNIEDLPRLIKKRHVAVFKEEAELFAADLPESRQSKFSAWLPVITGCNNFCTYCAVPYVRGREKSLPLDKAVDLASKAVASGAVEITLLGQNVNTYGKDIYKKPQFAKLLKEISNIKGLRRIRFATSHPKDLIDEVIDAIMLCDNVCKNIHLPVQSGSTEVLKNMGRRYTKESYIELVDNIRKKIPGVSISTDIMVGFPGETDQNFEDTMELVEKCRFDSAFTFIYSPRPGTKAFHLKEVDSNITANRFSRLTEAIKSLAHESNRKLEGKTVEVLVEGKSKKDNKIFSGRTQCNRLVHFKGKEIKEGNFVKVNITKSFSWYLTGDING